MKQAKRLFLYGDFEQPAIWAESKADFVKKTGSKEETIIRFHHGDHPLPEGYTRTKNFRGEDSGLACDPIVPIPTMKSFIQSLTPGE